MITWILLGWFVPGLICAIWLLAEEWQFARQYKLHGGDFWQDVLEEVIAVICGPIVLSYKLATTYCNWRANKRRFTACANDASEYRIVLTEKDIDLLRDGDGYDISPIVGDILKQCDEQKHMACAKPYNPDRRLDENQTDYEQRMTNEHKIILAEEDAVLLRDGDDYHQELVVQDILEQCDGQNQETNNEK